MLKAQENDTRQIVIDNQRFSRISRFLDFRIFMLVLSIMMSVSKSNKGKPFKLRHYDISREHFKRTAQRLIYFGLPAEDRQKYGEDKVGRLVKSMYGTQDASHIWQLDLLRIGRIRKRQT